MANPAGSHIVHGTVSDRLGNPLSGVTVTLTHATIGPVLTKKTDTTGTYLLNLGDLTSEWKTGQTITLFSTATAQGRKSVITTIQGQGQQTVNITYEETSDSFFDPHVPPRFALNFGLLTSYDGEKITAINPLPVNSSEIDLMFNPATEWVITRGDGQPDTETVTLVNGDQHQRTYGYDGKGFLVSRSKWVKQ